MQALPRVRQGDRADEAALMFPGRTASFPDPLTTVPSSSPTIREGEGTVSQPDVAGEDLYRRIVEAANQGIWAIDTAQRTMFINAKLAGRLGYQPQEVVGRPAWDLVFPEDHGEAAARWAERTPGEETRVEFRLRRQDGAEVWFDAAISPLHDVEGRFTGALGLFADITERRRADEALRQSERQARLLADSMPHIVWTARGDGTVDYFNGRWYEYTGMSPEESLEHPGWRLAVHLDDLGSLLNVRDPAVEEGQVFQADVRLRDREGAYRWHMVRSVPVRDDADRVIRRFGTATDIDDRMRAEEDSPPASIGSGSLPNRSRRWSGPPPLMARWTIPVPGSSSFSVRCASRWKDGRGWT